LAASVVAAVPVLALARVPAVVRLPEPVVLALARHPEPVVRVRRLVEEALVALPLPSSPSFLFVMARSTKLRAIRALCVPVQRSRWLQKDPNFLSM
jgi:hypothetical protein